MRTTANQLNSSDANAESPVIIPSQVQTTNSLISRETAMHLQALTRIADIAQKWVRSEKVPSSADSPTFSRQANSRMPQVTEATLVKRLHRIAIREIFKALSLERCAIIRPHGRRTGFWTIVEHLGVPNTIAAQSYYSMGEGLTGQVLFGEVITSNDVLNDDRHSSRYGGRWINSDGSIDETNTRRAYVGAPMWMQRTDREQDPVGAIYAIRAHREFSPGEITFVKLAAQIISFGHDRLRSWRRRAESDVRQLRLSQLWQSPGSDDHKYEEVLHILREEFPFPRLLLSLLDEHAGRMLGVAAVGFRPDIIRETNRSVAKPHPAFSSQETAENSEDILAMIYRLRSAAPRIVSPTDREWAKVNRVTAFRHQVRHPLLLVPMLSSKGTVMGVLLAELPTEYLLLGPNEIDRLSLFVNHVGHLIESHRRSTSLRSSQRTWSQIHDTAFKLLGDHKSMDRYAGVSHLMQTVCNHAEITTAVLYRLDEKDRILRGVSGVGVSDSVIRQHFIQLRGESGLSDSIPIAIEAVLRGKGICRNYTAHSALSTDRSILNCMDLGPGTCVNAIPTFDGAGCNGVLLFVDREVSSVCTGPDTLSQFAPVLGHCLSVIDCHERASRAEGASSAFQSLAFAIGEMGRVDADGAVLGNGDIACQSVLRDASVMFDSALSQLFLFDEPIRLPPDASAGIELCVRGKRLVEQGRFMDTNVALRFQGRVNHTSRPTTTITIGSELGLTASVVKSLSVVMSPDVENDPFWSKRDIGLSGCRAFLGVPLLAEIHDSRVLFGTLTMTRLRMSSDDSRAFKYEEIQTVQNIAALIAAALQRGQAIRQAKISVQQEIDRADEVRSRVSRCLGWFRHDIPGMITNLEREIDRYVRSAKDCNPEQHLAGASELRSLAEATRSVFVACALGLGEENAVAAGTSPSMRMRLLLNDDTVNFESLESQVRLLIRSENRLGDTVIEPFTVPTEREMTGVWATPLMYVCFALIHNAVIACYYNKKNTTAENPGHVCTSFHRNPESLVMTVEDDGGGTGGATWDVLSQELYSRWKANVGDHHGMGLHIVKRIVKEHMNGAVHVEDRTHEDGRRGAVFCVTIPLCQPTDD